MRGARRTLDADVLRLHLVLAAALEGRASGDYLKRVARRAAQSARAVALGPVCAVCGGPLRRGRLWIAYKGLPYAVARNPIPHGRAYCTERCAWAQIERREDEDDGDATA